jgi:hypothetical protein
VHERVIEHRERDNAQGDARRERLAAAGALPVPWRRRSGCSSENRRHGPTVADVTGAVIR